MKINLFGKFLLVLLLVTALPAAAREDSRLRASIAPAEPDCAMTETANVGINFNSTETDVSKIKPMMDAKTEEVRALAKSAGIDKLDLQSSNYSIYTNSGGGCSASGANTYQYNGSVSFNVSPGDKAANFMVLLTQKGFNANVNVNAYKQCP